MNCDITREQLIAYLYDEDIHPNERERLKAHIETCPSCSQILEELGSTSRILNAWGDEKPDLDLVFVQERQSLWQNLLPTRYPKTWVGAAIAAILIFTFLNIEFAIRDGAFHAAIGLRSSDSLEQIAIADTPITLGEFIIHQQNLIDYTNRLVHASQNQQRDEVNGAFIRLVGELETQRQQDLLRVDRGLQILYNTQEIRYGHILGQMDSVKKELFFYDNATDVLIVPEDNRPYRTIPTGRKAP